MIDLRDKNLNERARIKGQVLSQLGYVPKTNYGDYEIEIVSANSIEKGVEILARVWNEGEQVGFGDGTIDIERFRVINPPLLTDDQDGNIEVNLTDNEGNKKIRRLNDDPKKVLFESLLKTVENHPLKYDSSRIIQNKVGSTTTTVYAGVDGQPRKLNANTDWATLVGSAGSDVTNVGPDAVLRFNAAAAGNTWNHLMRYIAIFDTSSIPDTDTITAATVTLTASGSKADPRGITPDLDIYVATPASDAAIVAADFSQIGTVSQSTGAVSWASLPGTDGNTIAWTYAIFTNISKTGNTRVGWRNASYDVAVVAPTWGSLDETRWDAYFVDATGTTKDPVMVITHGAAATASHYLLMGV